MHEPNWNLYHIQHYHRMKLVSVFCFVLFSFWFDKLSVILLLFMSFVMFLFSLSLFFVIFWSESFRFNNVLFHFLFAQFYEHIRIIEIMKLFSITMHWGMPVDRLSMANVSDWMSEWVNERVCMQSIWEWNIFLSDDCLAWQQQHQHQQQQHKFKEDEEVKKNSMIMACF